MRGKGSIKSPLSGQGELILTNLRLIFRSKHGLHVIPLEEVANVWTDRSVFSSKLYVDTGDETYELCVKSPEKWAAKIEKCAERLEEVSKYLFGVKI